MQYIRETAIKDIVDLIIAIKDGNVDFLKKRASSKDYSGSISKSSKDLVMTFPVLCTNTIEPSVANMISKAHEKKCLMMLQMLFASTWKSSATDAKEFIGKYHKNFDVDGLLPSGMVDKSIDELISQGFDTIADAKTNGVVSALTREETNIIYRDSINAINEKSLPVDSTNPRSLLEFRITDGYNGINVTTLSEANDKNKNNTNYSKNILNYEEIFHKQLLDSDVKKVNEAVPAMLIIRYNETDEKGKTTCRQSIVGVKSRLIAVDSAEIVDRLYVKASDKNWLLKLIRATTREISFTKDFLFAIDRAKIDAVSKSRKGSTISIWKSLEARSTKNKMNKALKRTNDATAITTLVVSIDEVEYLDKNYNVNLRNTAVAKQLLDAYNLLAIYIVDPVTESVSSLYDGESIYETLSFNNLERESRDGAGAYKQVLNMMNKLNSRM